MKQIIWVLLIMCLSSVYSKKTDAQNVTDTIGNTPVVIHTVLDRKSVV